jgi:hypothetical protein
MTNDAGRLQQYTLNGRLASGSPFDGATSGEVLKFARSFTNYDPAAHPLPAWRHLDNPLVPLR